MNQQHFRDRNEWRSWLAANHGNEKEIRVIFYKKHTKKESITLNEAVEEALCYGWIDSVSNSIDEERYMLKFTPRNPRSNWSLTNKKRVLKLIAEGKMTDEGMRLVTFDLGEAEKEVIAGKSQSQAELTGTYLEILMGNTAAFMNYTKMSPSHKRQYTGYILAAKKEETRLRRLDRVIAMLEEDKRYMF